MNFVNNTDLDVFEAYDYTNQKQLFKFSNLSTTLYRFDLDFAYHFDNKNCSSSKMSGSQMQPPDFIKRDGFEWVRRERVKYMGKEVESNLWRLNQVELYTVADEKGYPLYIIGPLNKNTYGDLEGKNEIDPNVFNVPSYC